MTASAHRSEPSTGSPTEATAHGKRATLKVFRGDSNAGELKSYDVETYPGMVVLDAVHQIQAHEAGDMAVRWWDEKAELTHWLYVYEHGKRLQVSPSRLRPGGPTDSALRTREVQLWNPSGDTDVVAGTDVSKSMVVVPIIGSDRALGTIQLENHEREDAFGES